MVPINPSVKKGYDKLLSYQLENGGIYKDMLASYNTAIAVSALSFSRDPPAVLAQARQGADLSRNHSIDGFDRGNAQRRDCSPGIRTSISADGDTESRAARMDRISTWPWMRCMTPTCSAMIRRFRTQLNFVTRLQNAATNDQPWAGNDGGFIYSTAFGGDYAGRGICDSSGRKMLRSYGSMTYADSTQ